MLMKERFLIAYILNGESEKRVNKLRLEIAEKFNVTAALRLPPHMTLFYPFESDGISPLIEKLKKITAKEKPFTIPIDGFMNFDDRVWFLNPKEDERLFGIKDQIVAAMKETTGIEENNEGRKTHFHITLAYKDLTSDVHRAIGEFLKEKELPIRDITIDNISILSWDGVKNIWTAEHIFSFTNSLS